MCIFIPKYSNSTDSAIDESGVVFSPTYALWRISDSLQKWTPNKNGSNRPSFSTHAVREIFQLGETRMQKSCHSLNLQHNNPWPCAANHIKLTVLLDDRVRAPRSEVTYARHDRLNANITGANSFCGDSSPTNTST